MAEPGVVGRARATDKASSFAGNHDLRPVPSALPGLSSSIGRSRTNCKVIVDVPNELVEFIDANPLICPNCRSSGVVIDETITSALAPG